MHSNLPFFYIGDILPDPYRVGDFPIQGEKFNLKKGIAEALGNIGKERIPELSFNKQVWFETGESGQTFRLEVVGYGQEHISAEIKNSVLHVSGKNGPKSFSERYFIPSSEKLDFSNVSVKVEHGLLEIIFAAKKTEVKSIKIL